MKVNILHLSDIHYGINHVANEREQRSIRNGVPYNKELEEIKESLEELEKKFNVRPNFIVVTGDITETSSPDEYLLAEEFIGGIADFLKIDRRYVVMIPGNHDVSWEICENERKRNKKGFIYRFLIKLIECFSFSPSFHDHKQDVDPILFPKFANYKKFFDRFYENADFPENLPPYRFSEDLFVTFPFPDEQVIYCGLNSCVYESDHSPHRGTITVRQLKTAIEEIDNIDTQKQFLRIALMHHNYIRGTQEDGAHLYDADDLKIIFLKAGFQMIMHGHEHKDYIDRRGDEREFFYIFATGSTGLDKQAIPEIGRRFQVLNIGNEYARIFRWRFDPEAEGTAGGGKWILTSTEDPFVLDNFNRHKAYKSLNEAVEAFQRNHDTTVFLFYGDLIGQYGIADSLIDKFSGDENDKNGDNRVLLKINCAILNRTIVQYLNQTNYDEDQVQTHFEDKALQTVCLQIIEQLNSRLPINQNHYKEIVTNIQKRWKTTPSFDTPKRKPMDSFIRFVEGIIFGRYLSSNGNENFNLFIIIEAFEQLFLSDRLSENHIDVTELIGILCQTFTNPNINYILRNTKIIIISISKELPSIHLQSLTPNRIEIK